MKVRFSRTTEGFKPLSVLFLSACLMSVNAGPAPASTPQAGFPKILLDGAPDFNLAIFLQGDVRGNVGPCG